MHPTLKQRFYNRLHSTLLIIGLSLLVGFPCWYIGGLEGAIGALIAIALIYLLNPSISPQLTLRIYGARRLYPEQIPELYQALDTLARRAELPITPHLYYFASPLVNAFAVGSPAQSAIVLSDGLLHQLSREAILGVLGHEISHIRHNDLRLMGFADLASRLAQMLSLLGLLLLLVSLPLLLITDLELNLWPILLLLVTPHLSLMLQLALSRTREYEADRGSAELIGSPRPLICALQQMEPPEYRLWQTLISPGRQHPEPSQIRTHPPTRERIQRLEAMQPVQQTPLIRLQPYINRRLPPLRAPGRVQRFWKARN